MLQDKFHYHTILGCDVTDFKYVTEYGRDDHFVMCLDHLCKATHNIHNSLERRLTTTDARDDGYSGYQLPPEFFCQTSFWQNDLVLLVDIES